MVTLNVRELKAAASRMYGMDDSTAGEVAASVQLSTDICRQNFVDNLTLVSGWKDEDLLFRLDRLASAERSLLPEMLACLLEVERRSLHLDRGFSSMFEYCVERLKWSEGTAMQRLVVAKAASRYPEIYSFLRDGQMNLSGVSRLSAHLTRENREQIFARAAGRKRADLDQILAELRALPAPRCESTPAVEESQVGLPFVKEGTLVPRANAPVDRTPPERQVRFSLLVGEKLRRDLDRARRLLQRRCPSERLEDLIAYLLRDFLRRRDPSLRRAAAERPRRERQTREVPRWVKDRVWKRDGGRCAYVAQSGRRCAAQGALQYDHIRPWARGGSSDDPANIRLLCRAHNLFAARRIFGDLVSRRRV